MPTLERPLERFSVDALRDTVTTFRDVIRIHQDRINRLNVYPVPDGDTGTNMARTLDAVVAEMEDAPEEMVPTCDAISHGSLMGARGNSGVILSQIMRGIAATLKADDDLSGPTVAAALRAASDAAYQGVLKPVEGTILTVVRASAAGAEAASAADEPLVGVLRTARAEAQAALEATPELLPVLADAGVVDAGGAGFVLLLDAALHVVDGAPLPEVDVDDEVVAEVAIGAVAHRSPAADELGVDEQRYEVMFLCELADDRIGSFKERWAAIGDSIVVVGGDGTWNCHVHTNDIGAAIEAVLDLDGRPYRIRVSDLFEEVAAEHVRRDVSRASPRASEQVGSVSRASPRASEQVGSVSRASPRASEQVGSVSRASPRASEQVGSVSRAGPRASEQVGAGPAPSSDAADLPAVMCAVVAVSSGPGITELFGELGVQAVVSGGQTLNPSTAELLAAVERVNADHVVVLPGNKNIIAVAEQLDALTSRTVRVVPTRSMPEGLAALMVYDPELPAEVNTNAMRHAAEAIDAGEVTRAVRASQTPAGPVAEGDWLGIARGDGIVGVAPDVVGAATAVLDRLVGDGRELVTLITGADADEATTTAIETWMGVHRPRVEVEVHDGGQPLYPYLFGVE